MRVLEVIEQIHSKPTAATLKQYKKEEDLIKLLRK